MAVIKAKYTTNKGEAKAHIRYIQNRRGKGGEKKHRTLYGHDSAMDRQEAYEIIDEAKKGIKFYKIMISPDPQKEDTGKDLNLWKITTKTIQELEKRLQQQDIQFVAAVHNDHKPHRHVHIVAVVPGRLNTQDLQLLRHSATEAALFQRRERDAAQGIKQEQGVRHELELSL